VREERCGGMKEEEWSGLNRIGSMSLFILYT